MREVERQASLGRLMVTAYGRNTKSCIVQFLLIFARLVAGTTKHKRKCCRTPLSSTFSVKYERDLRMFHAILTRLVQQIEMKITA